MPKAPKGTPKEYTDKKGNINTSKIGNKSAKTWSPSSKEGKGAVGKKGGKGNG